MFSRWSTLTAAVAALRKLDSLIGFASVPELTASLSNEASSCCWSLILARSERAKECRSRTNLSAVIPCT